MDSETGTDPSASSPSESVPAPPAARLPRRSQSDRYLGGVAGGIAGHYDIDPFIIRAALLGSTLFSAYAADWVPVVPAAYTLLWLMLPGPTGTSTLRDFRSRSGRRETVAALSSFIVLALMLTRPVFGIALALAALAWVLLSDKPPPDSLAPLEQRPTNPTAADESLPFASDAVARESWGRRRRSERGEALVANFIRTPRRPRREPALWPLTVSLLAIVAVGGFMADASFDHGVDPGVLVNLALIAIGSVVMVSAWRGRALWTVLLGLALLPAWIGFSVADVGRFSGSGTTTHTPTALPASGTLEYENGYGSMTIDLRGLPLADGDRLSLDIKTTAGTVTVLAPPTAETLLQSKVGLGTTTVRGDGLSFYEYDREPHMDRTMVRRYQAHGLGCVQDYWSAWWLMVANHENAGVDLDGFDASDPSDVDSIVAAIGAAGFVEPQLIDTGGGGAFGYENPNGQPYIAYDEAGNEYIVADGSAYPVQVDEQEYLVPSGLQTGDGVPVALESDNAFPAPLDPAPASNLLGRTWSYSADRDGVPCVATAPSTDPATIEINATIGIGTLEVHRDDF